MVDLCQSQKERKKTDNPREGCASIPRGCEIVKFFFTVRESFSLNSFSQGSGWTPESEWCDCSCGRELYSPSRSARDTPRHTSTAAGLTLLCGLSSHIPRRGASIAVRLR